MTIEDDWDYEPAKPNQWVCQSCGAQVTKPWPTDRAKFYAGSKPAKCPKCKSEALMPQGF